MSSHDDHLQQNEARIQKERLYKCYKCKRHLPADLFYTNRARNTGLASMCKECQELYTGNYYQKNADKLRLKAMEYQRRKRAAEKLEKLKHLRAGRGWTPQELQDFITEMAIALPTFQDRELFELLEDSGFLDATRLIVTTPVAQVLKDLRKNAGEGLKAAIKRANKGSQSRESGKTASDEAGALFEGQQDKAAEVDAQRLPGSEGTDLESLATVEKLREVDQFAALIGQAGELAEGLVSARVSGLWERYYEQGQAVVQELKAHNEGRFYMEIKERFLAELAEVQSLAVPRGWDFEADGVAHGPTIMQLRTACMLRNRRRIGNWSGTGAGKTLAAILSSRVVDARITLVITNNAVVDGWKGQITNAFPDSTVHTAVADSQVINSADHTYFVLNYEKFQGPGRDNLVERLLRLPLGFIVLDEVQFVKQRGDVVSKRREAINSLVQQSADKNLDLCVLGMSATPVINELGEAKALLEIITGLSLVKQDTRPTMQNGFAMNRALMRYGFRYKPRNAQKLKFIYEVTVRNELLDALIAARRNPLTVEQLLLPARLEAVRDHIAKGTIIYSHYVDGMVVPIRDYVQSLGLSVGVHTGKDKSGLASFLRGEVDVLIGSSTLATGVDGLQRAASKLIMISLPWTSALYDQITGRVHRHGSAFDAAEVVFPQVTLDNNGDIWSWDQARMRYIENKRTLADCAVDGVVPTMERISRATLVAKGHSTLEDWKARLEKNR